MWSQYTAKWNNVIQVGNVILQPTCEWEAAGSIPDKNDSFSLGQFHKQYRIYWNSNHTPLVFQNWSVGCFDDDLVLQKVGLLKQIKTFYNI